MQKALRIAGTGIVASILFVSIQGAWARFAPCHQTFDLINPARRCTSTFAQGEWNYEELRELLEKKKVDLKASGELTHLSIYFQDLTNGPRFGIGEYDKFHPASLMKLPVLIFYLHAADLEPALLDATLSFTDDLEVRENVDVEESIAPNTPYTIRELLRKMIVHSDNRSYVLLLREMHELSTSTAYYTFRDLDVLHMMMEADGTYVSISWYAKLYAILYNTGYLSREMSQFALELLSETDFRGGIVSGVPPNVRVAHKFGYTSVDGEFHLHDCGIVYHPEMAYVLCVMTTGTDQNLLNDSITEISRTVYNAITPLLKSKDRSPLETAL